ncbi:MAG: DUF3299 domain-containing protein [Bacteroidota bacterium]
MKLFTILGFLLFSTAGFSQETISWELLRDVKFAEKFNEELGSYINVPTFGNSVKAKAGKEVQITGYVIPLDVKQNVYVLSANPYAACFFCGGAGPETVIDLKFIKAPKKYKTDERVTVKGKLKLNATDIYQLTYVLENAVQVK